MTRHHLRDRAFALCVLCLGTFSLGACGRPEGVPPEGSVPPEFGETEVAPMDTTAARAEAPAGSLVPMLPGEGPPREFQVLLVNPTTSEVRVFAEAGAARVALDTVPAGDSTRVDIRMRAGRVDLAAEDSAGTVIVIETVELTDTLNRWVVSLRASRPPRPDSAAVSLVLPDRAGYPRTQPNTLRR